MTFSNIIAWLCMLLVAMPVMAGTPPAIEHFTLKNGMQVVLIPSHRVPAVTHMLWYKVGGADDFPGRSGLAHYNEHMMFQGTETMKGGEFARIIAGHGGHTNAFTGRDYTAYYVSIAKDQLPLVMQMEADRMLHLAPTPENFTKEREVIIEERRMSIENQPEALLGEEMQALLFRNHPYRNPLIGWMQEMQALSREDVLAFHKQFYHPANATLVVSGDITRAELEPMAEQYYGGLPAGDPAVRHWNVEPPQRGPRHTAMRHPNVTEPQFLRYYVAPSVGYGDKALVVPGLVLSQILGGGQSSRLYQSLVVKQKLATGVEVDYEGISVGPGLLEIGATPARGVALPKLEEAVDAEINALSAGLVKPAELTRAQTLLKADTIYARDGLEGMARTLGTLVMSGLPPEYFNQFPALIDAVTPDDVKRAANVIFDPSSSVTGYLLPPAGRQEDPGASPAAAHSLLHSEVK